MKVHLDAVQIQEGPWFAPAPKGSPDKYVTTRPMRFIWWDPPQWAWDMVRKQVQDEFGLIRRCETSPRRCIELLLRAGFFFSTSVAPDFEAAMPGVATHDWIYQAVAKLAIAWGLPMRDVLRFGNRFFLALLNAGKFRLKYTWYYSVEIFGYLYNRMNAARGGDHIYTPGICTVGRPPA